MEHRDIKFGNLFSKLLRVQMKDSINIARANCKYKRMLHVYVLGVQLLVYFQLVSDSGVKRRVSSNKGTMRSLGLPERQCQWR